MSERERWVVYPLLFLALGAALRDKLFDRTTTRSIVCQELIVVEEEPTGQRPVQVLAQIGRIDSTRGAATNRYMVVNGQLDADLVNAQQYAYRDVPFMPALQAILPSPTELLEALQRSMQASDSTPPNSDANASGAQQAPKPDTDKETGSSAEPPLADPIENR